MAKIFDINRPNNKITLGTTGTTINIASHTASKILALNAGKDLEVVTIGSSLDYTRPILNTVQDIRTSASPTFTGLTLSSMTQGSVLFAGAGGVISKDAGLFWDNTAKQLKIIHTDAQTEKHLALVRDTNAVYLKCDTAGALEFTVETNIYFDGAYSGAKKTLRVWNESTDADSSCRLQLLTQGANSGDAYLHLGINTVQDWTIGIDNSDSDKLKIGPNAAVGTNTAITIDTSLNVDIVAHNASTVGLKLGGTLVTSSAAELNLLDGITAVQEQGDVLDDLNTLGVVGANSEFLVGTGAGVLAWENAGTARTSLGVGTEDSPAFAGVNLGDSSLADGKFVSQTNVVVLIDSNNDQTTRRFVVEKDTTTPGSGTELFRVQEDGNVVVGKTSGIGIKVDTSAPTFGFADLLGDQFSKNTGSSKPTLVEYISGVNAWQFSVGDEAYLTYHIPHDYVPGTDIHLHVHWSQNNVGATGGTIDFKYLAIYAKGHNQASGSVFTSPNPITAIFPSININDGGSGLNRYQQHITEVTISAASATAALFDRDDLEPDGVIELTFAIEANNLTGTPSNPFIHFVDIHYQTTGLIGTKAKAPDFYT